MFKEFSENEKDDDYLSEFKQKIANQQREDMEERRQELQRSRNGFIGTLAGIVLAGIVSWILLVPRFSGTDSGDIPVIRRPITPAKIQPSEPGGMEILNQDKSVYDLVEKKENVPEKIESILPEPETPKMPVIVPETENNAPAADENNAIPESGIETLIETEIESEITDPLPVKVLEEDLKPVSTTSGEKINIPEKLPEINVEVKTVSSKPAESKPTKTEPAENPMKVKSADKTAPETVAKKESVPDAKMKPAQPVKTDKPQTDAKKTQTAAAGTWQIQLIASANKQAVEDAWKDLSATHNILKSMPHEIESATINGGTFYRLKAGAFTERSDADKACAEIKANGGSCIVKQK